MSMKRLDSQITTVPIILRVLLPMLPILLMLLSGCGVSAGANGSPLPGQSSGTPTVTRTSTPTIPGASNTTTGCPLATQSVQWSSPPTIIITSAEASKGGSVRVGQTLEVALAFGHRWSMSPTSGSSALLLSPPAGYGDASLKSCVWRFTAKQVGQVTLVFLFAPICQAHMACPQYAGLLKIPVDVLGQ